LRLAAAGRKFFGLNEVRIGVPVPYLAGLILRQIAGDRTATQMVYSGQFLEPDAAQRAGVVDAVCPPEQVESRALEMITDLAERPPNALAIIKQNRVEAAVREYENTRRQKDRAFLDCWFDPEVQKLLAAAAEKF